jgi:uncharacterized protein (TIGR03435 family)
MKRTLDHLLGLFRKPSRELEQSIQERVAKRLGLEISEDVHDTPRARRWQWPAVAAIAAAITLAVFIPTRIAQSAPAMLEDANGSRKIQFGEIVRPTGDKNATLSMADGSRLEVQSNSELSLERADDGGTLVRLNRGALTVMAAVTGEVRVQQGATETRLRAGEQASSPSSATPPKEQRVAFEEVSIRWRQGSGAGGPAERGLGGGNGPAGGPCESLSQVQLDPKRFAVTRAGLLWLITAAYDIGPRGAGGRFQVRCRDAVNMKLLSEGPDWVRTMEFDVEALLPPGIPAYTQGQMERGEAPEIQKMLQAMLAERFKLVLKREAREMPGYVLSVAPNGAKLTPAREIPASVERDGGVNPANPSAGSWGTRQFPDCSSLRRMIEEGVDNEAANRCRRHDYGAGTVFGGVRGTRFTLDRFAGQLQALTERPVVNRTGISGVFDYDLIFAPTLPSLTRPLARYIDEGRTILSGPTLFKAIEEQMGLRLEPLQGPVETFVIVSVDRPTEN